MIQEFHWVAALVAALPGRMTVGQTRLQMSVYLLQHKGLPTGCRFDLHFGGPFSEGLGVAVLLAKQFDLMTVEEPNREDQESIIYRAKESAVMPEIEQYRVWIDMVVQAEVVVLELAANYMGFLELGYNHSDAIARTRRKKARKWSPENEAKMLALLGQLRLLHEEANVA